MKDIGNTKHIAGCLVAVNPFHQDQYKNSFTTKITGKMLQILFLTYFVIDENTVC
jgi:hypothetical protein